jgi:hypothetical protein
LVREVAVDLVVDPEAALAVAIVGAEPHLPQYEVAEDRVGVQAVVRPPRRVGTMADRILDLHPEDVTEGMVEVKARD